jgi:DNA mismatch repair protein MutS
MTRPLKLTPMLEQYFEIKRQVPDAILFYRLGDFYEMFFEDAEKAAPLLDLVLTARGRGGDSEAPMCGVPYHASDQYVARLIRAGLSVAICDQVGDPAPSKGIVRREITRVVTPGTAIESAIVEKESCYLLSFAADASGAGGAFLDVSTGDFFVKRYAGEGDPRLADDLARFNPRELILAREAHLDLAARARALGVIPTFQEASFFDPRLAFEFLTRHLATAALRGFGLDEQNDPRVAAAGAALRYAVSSHRKDLAHVRGIRVETDEDALILDVATLENLEVFDSRDSTRPRASLWSIVNETRTAVGSRTLRLWLSRPLLNRDGILDRHDAVEELVRTRRSHEAICHTLSRIADLERLVSRTALGTASPRECLALADSLEQVAQLRSALAEFRGPLLQSLGARLVELRDVVLAIRSTLEEEPAVSAREGGVIREGIDPELDELRGMARDSKAILLRIESEERSRTGIPSLKIRFNSVFGYYIEVSKVNLARVPSDYIRKQTLVNAERFITPELKELEEKILGAEEKSVAIEVRLYEELLRRVAGKAAEILATAMAVGEVDVLSSYASTAMKRRYVRAALSDEQEIEVEDGRHPVIEAISTERFIPNSTSVRRERDGVQIITGPNMGGKSTYLRQVALTVLLNQAGSFVPAGGARLGLFDRIFTRVGASDHLARGESTFMVEMHETANILHNATPRSLIILDEVGRGTATFDGLSLAWAIVEFLHDSVSRSAITLFATHYHELTDLSKTRERVANQNVAVKEWNDGIIFLRKVVPGAADKSYGIHVAKLAGIPDEVVTRAREILATLERHERDIVEETRKRSGGVQQIPLFPTRVDDVLETLRSLPVECMSPIEALNKLAELQKKLLE